MIRSVVYAVFTFYPKLRLWYEMRAAYQWAIFVLLVSALLLFGQKKFTTKAEADAAMHVLLF